MNLPFEVSKSQDLKGIRCLVATESIKKGKIIEKCPVVPIRPTEVPFLIKTVLNNYSFIWKKNEEAIVLGYGMMYNHSHDPNVYFLCDIKNKLMIYKAIRDIKTGEELFINYNQGENGPLDLMYTHFDKEIL